MVSGHIVNLFRKEFHGIHAWRKLSYSTAMTRRNACIVRNNADESTKPEGPKNEQAEKQVDLNRENEEKRGQAN